MHKDTGGRGSTSFGLWLFHLLTSCLQELTLLTDYTTANTLKRAHSTKRLCNCKHFETYNMHTELQATVDKLTVDKLLKMK